MRLKWIFIIFLILHVESGASGAEVEFPKFQQRRQGSFRQNQEFLVGASSVNVPIPDRIALGGYFQRRFIFGKNQPPSPFAQKFKASVGQHDPIRVKSIVVNFKGTLLAFVSIDVVALSPRLKKELIDRIGELGFSPEQLMLTATHTHSGPGCFIHEDFWQSFAVDTFVPEFYNELLSSVEQSIRLAYAHQLSAQMSIERFMISDISQNRRGRIFLDPILTWIKFTSMDHQPIANWVIFPVHGDVLNPDNLHISADLGGAFERTFDRQVGGVSLFSMGAGGDVDPYGVSADFEGLNQLEEKITRTLQEFILRHKTEERSFVPQKMNFLKTSVSLPPAKLDVAACSDWIAPFRGLWPIALPAYFNEPALLTGLNIDNELLLFIPGEPFVEIGRTFQNIAQKAGYSQATVVSLANSYYGYIMDEAEYLFGGYETCNSFYGPKFGEKMIQGVRDLLSLER